MGSSVSLSTSLTSGIIGSAPNHTGRDLNDNVPGIIPRSVISANVRLALL